jgi:hypothetical protein
MELGYQANKYRIEYRVEGTNKWKSKTSTVSLSNGKRSYITKTLTTIEKGKTYQVRIKAYRTDGTVWSKYSKMKTSKKIK